MFHPYQYSTVDPLYSSYHGSYSHAIDIRREDGLEMVVTSTLWCALVLTD